jgi:triacylglycerol lipase
MSAWLLRGNAPIRRLNGPASKLRLPLAATRQQPCRTLSSSPYALRRDGDPRIRDLGREISDDFATVRDTYGKPTTLLLRKAPYPVL